MTARRTDSGEEVRLTCSFLYMCTGYYRYDEGYSPDFAGSDDFTGRSCTPSIGRRISTAAASGSW